MNFYLHIILLGSVLWAWPSSSKRIMTVFIHGTLHQSIRHEKIYTYACDLVLNQGLVTIDLETWQKNALHEAQPHAAFHIINGFDACYSSHALAQGDTTAKRIYYTFGWSGELSSEARKRAAHELYDCLQEEYERLRKEDPHVEIELYGHSHGNQLIFYLAAVRDMYPEHAWQIDLAVLSAAPLHYEMARHVAHPLFKAIINIYSEGDMIQTLDFISVPPGGCRRAFHAIPELQPYLRSCTKCIADICIGAYNHYNFFGHGSFFTLDRYTPHPTISRNLRQNYRKLIAQLNPLPLVAFYPLIIAHTRNSGYTSLSANIFQNDNDLAITIYNNSVPETTQYIVFPADFFKTRDFTQQCYQAHGYISEIAKLYWACVYSLRKMLAQRSPLNQLASPAKDQGATQ